MAATEPEQMHGTFEEAFNAGDIDALMELYEPDATLVPQPGALAEGTAAIRESLAWFLDRRAGSRSIRSSSCVSATSRTSRTVGR
jgi:ketosteroid isomerase-like protein